MTDAALAPAKPDSFIRNTLAAAWMAIILELIVQGAVFGAKVFAGGKVPQAQLILDVAGGVTWSVIVCGAIAIGTAASRGLSGAMGLLGLLGAPLAFAAMKALQRALSEVVSLPPEQLTPLLFQTGGLKAIEYGLLGFVLGTIIRTPRSTLTAHLAIGVGFGGAFAAAFVGLIFLNAPPGTPPPLPRILGTATNELIFPVGCSMVLYWVSQLASRVSR